MSHHSFDDPGQDVFLPQFDQDESLDSVLQHPSFSSFEHGSLESLGIPSPEPLPFDTSGPPPASNPTPPLSNQSREESSNVNQRSQDFHDALQKPSFHSKPCIPQPQPSSRPTHYRHHTASSSNPNHPLTNDHLYYNPGVSQPGLLHHPPHHTPHQRAHSQPPEHVTFFRAPHQSSRAATRTLTGGIPLSNTPGPHYATQPTPHGIPIARPTSRYHAHPYRSNSRSRRDAGPTSAPPPHMRGSPRPLSARGMHAHSSEMQEVLQPHQQQHQSDSPMFVQMQTPEEVSGSGSAAQSPRAIEVGAAGVKAALGDMLRGAVTPEQAAVVLRFVDQVEIRQRETLRVCERIRDMFAKEGGGERVGEGEEPDADVEPLRLDGPNESANEPSESQGSAAEPLKQESSQDQDIQIG